MQVDDAESIAMYRQVFGWNPSDLTDLTKLLRISELSMRLPWMFLRRLYNQIRVFLVSGYVGLWLCASLNIGHGGGGPNTGGVTSSVFGGNCDLLSELSEAFLQPEAGPITNNKKKKYFRYTPETSIFIW